jgi:hypothetical protein
VILTLPIDNGEDMQEELHVMEGANTGAHTTSYDVRYNILGCRCQLRKEYNLICFFRAQVEIAFLLTLDSVLSSLLPCLTLITASLYKRGLLK